MNKNMITIMYAALVVMAVAFIGMFVFGCNLPAPPTDKEVMENTNVVGLLKTPAGWSNVLVLRDETRHVTCYDSGAGISCLKD